MRRDQNVRPVLDDLVGLAEHHLDEARILADRLRKLERGRRWLDIGKADVTSFGFRNDLLRDDEHVAPLETQRHRGQGGSHDDREVVPWTDMRDAVQGDIFDAAADSHGIRRPISRSGR